jgi:hypothetical protein
MEFSGTRGARGRRRGQRRDENENRKGNVNGGRFLLDFLLVDNQALKIGH